MQTFKVVAFYKFVQLDNYGDLREPLRVCAHEHRIMGTVLLAPEGINGTVSGPVANIDAFLTQLRLDPRLSDLEHKESFANENPFYRLKIRLKREIVTLGVGDVNAADNAGTYIEPAEWDGLISDPDTVVVDTRNAYEVAIGTFEGALDPHTSSFGEFPDWFEKNRERLEGKKVAMFCTGGIRCEKSTAYLKSQGIHDVFHLKGGILKYLEEIPASQSRWQGECFVFDQRVSVGHGLEPGPYDLCNACRLPISDEDKQSSHYIEGVSCPHCHDVYTTEQKARFSERQKQVALAKARGETHIAADQLTARERKRAHIAARCGNRFGKGDDA